MAKSLGQFAKEQMLESAEKALQMTAEDVLKRAQRDVPKEDGELLASGRVHVVRVGDALEAKVEFTADHAASQEIGGRSAIKADKRPEGVPHRFIKFRNHPGGGKPHYLGDAVKTGVRRYRANLKRTIAADLKARNR